jgi:hypothetical protein
MHRERVGEERGSKEMDGCPLTVSLPLLFSPTIPLIYPCLYVYSPYLCTISRDHTHRPTTFIFKV